MDARASRSRPSILDRPGVIPNVSRDRRRPDLSIGSRCARFLQKATDGCKAPIAMASSSRTAFALVSGSRSGKTERKEKPEECKGRVFYPSRRLCLDTPWVALLAVSRRRSPSHQAKTIRQAKTTAESHESRRTKKSIARLYHASTWVHAR